MKRGVEKVYYCQFKEPLISDMKIISLRKNPKNSKQSSPFIFFPLRLFCFYCIETVKWGTKRRMIWRESKHLKQQSQSISSRDENTCCVDLYRWARKRHKTRQTLQERQVETATTAAFKMQSKSNLKVLFRDRIERSVSWLFVLPRVLPSIDHLRLFNERRMHETF